MSNQDTKNEKEEYDFGGIEEFNLQQIEEEILNESIYLDVFAGSDVRFKTDIEPANNELQNIVSLQAYKYLYNQEKFPEQNFDETEQVGLMAQDVEKVYPHAVKKDDKGFRYVNYAMLTPGLIEAVKELNKVVESQGKMIEELKKKLLEN